MTQSEYTKIIEWLASNVEARRSDLIELLKGIMASSQEPAPQPSSFTTNLYWAEQYDNMIAALKKYEIPLDGVPKFEDLKMPPEILDKLQYMIKPTLLLVPPLPREKLIDLFDTSQDNKTYTYNFADDALWGKDSQEWRVMIVESVVDVEEKKPGNWGKQAKAWQEEADRRGIKLINDAQTYFALQILSHEKNTPIDIKYFTTLNADRLTDSGLVAYADFRSVIRRGFFGTDNPDGVDAVLRGRSSVQVEF